MHLSIVNRKEDRSTMLNAIKLQNKIRESGTSVARIAKDIGVCPSTFYRKMAQNSFRICEVDAIVQKLAITLDDAVIIFFTQYGA